MLRIDLTVIKIDLICATFNSIVSTIDLVKKKQLDVKLSILITIESVFHNRVDFITIESILSRIELIMEMHTTHFLDQPILKQTACHKSQQLGMSLLRPLLCCGVAAPLDYVHAPIISMRVCARL